MLPQSERASDEENSLHNEKDCENQRDDRDARRDADKQRHTSCDADQRKERLKEPMRHLLAKECHKQGDNTANKRERPKELGNYN